VVAVVIFGDFSDAPAAGVDRRLRGRGEVLTTCGEEKWGGEKGAAVMGADPLYTDVVEVWDGWRGVGTWRQGAGGLWPAYAGCGGGVWRSGKQGTGA
jgi:hypothetical protein